MPSPAHSATSDSDSPLTGLSPYTPKDLRTSHTFPVNPGRRSRDKQHAWYIGKPSLDMLKADKAAVERELAHLEDGQGERRSELKNQLRQLTTEIERCKNKIEELEYRKEMLQKAQKEADQEYDQAIARLDSNAPRLRPFLGKIRAAEHHVDLLQRSFKQYHITEAEYDSKAYGQRNPKKPDYNEDERKEREWEKKQDKEQKKEKQLEYLGLQGYVDLLYGEATAAYLGLSRPKLTEALQPSKAVSKAVSKVKKLVEFKLLPLRSEYNRETDDRNKAIRDIEDQFLAHKHQGWPQYDTFRNDSSSASRSLPPHVKDQRGSPPLTRHSSAPSDVGDISGKEDVDPKWRKRIARLKSKTDLVGMLRSRSKSRGRGGEEDEEEELSRIPHVGYRAGLIYYGRAY